MVGPERRYPSKPGLLQCPPSLLQSDPGSWLKHSFSSGSMISERSWESRSNVTPVTDRRDHYHDANSLLGEPNIWSQNQLSGPHYQETDHPYTVDRQPPSGGYVPLQQHPQSDTTELKDSVEDFIGTVMSVIHSKLVKMMNGKDEIEQQDLLDGLISIIGRAGKDTEVHSQSSHSQGIRNERSGLLGPRPLLQENFLDKYVTHSDSPQLLRKMLPALHKKLLEMEPDRSGLLGDHPFFRSSEIKALMKQYARRVNDQVIESNQLGLLGEHPVDDQPNAFMKDYQDPYNESVSTSPGILGSHPSELDVRQRQSGLLGNNPLEYEFCGAFKSNNTGLLGDHPKELDEVELLKKESFFAEVSKSFEPHDRNTGLLGSHPLSKEVLSTGKQFGLLGDCPSLEQGIPSTEASLPQSGLLGDHPVSPFSTGHEKPGLLGPVPETDNIDLPDPDPISYHIQAARRKKPLIDIPGMQNPSDMLYETSVYDTMIRDDYPSLLGDEPLSKRARLQFLSQELSSGRPSLLPSGQSVNKNYSLLMNRSNGRPYSQQTSLLGDYPILPLQRSTLTGREHLGRSSGYRSKQRKSYDKGKASNRQLKKDDSTTDKGKSFKTEHKKDDRTKSRKSPSRKSENAIETFSDNETVKNSEQNISVKQEANNDSSDVKKCKDDNSNKESD